MDLEIQTQHCEIHPRWRALIQRRMAKLTEFSNGILRVHVTVVHSAHHQRGDEEVRLLVTVPNGTLRVQKKGANMSDAIHASFSALERELEVWTARRKRFTKQPGPQPAGTIARMMREQGYGVILMEDGREVYFHRNALRQLDFETLEQGTPVEFDLEHGEKGLQAASVFPAGERST